jgi:hypothetical protein
MEIDTTLVTAYQNAEYVVFADKEIVMLIDEQNDELQKLMSHHQCTQAAFITAYNPFSEILKEAENIQRQNQLTEELTRLGYKLIQGLGRDKEDQWPGEKSVLVLNIPLDTAKNLGNKYGQNAIVWIEENAIPQLLLLKGENG